MERLLEGLPGALDLEEYKFHVERGYGSAYFNQVRSLAAAEVAVTTFGS